MKLNYITLKNFRQYYGKQTIHFATNKGQHVTVIHGINGAGKTSLCIALNWCLYGDRLIKDRFGDIGELVSRHDVLNTDTSVKIGFTYQEAKYTAERKCLALHNSQSKFSLKKEGDIHPHLDAEASERIRSIIPENVSAYFFFDGEKIDNFARPGHEDDVKSAVRNVLKVEVIDRGKKHLENVAQEYHSKLTQELSKYPPSELEGLLNKIEILQGERKENYQALAQKRQEIRNAKKQIQEIDQRLESIEESRKLAEERKEIEETLEQFKQERLEIQEKIQKLTNQGYIPIAKSVLHKALEILDGNEIPIVPEALLNELLKQKYCLCGRPISKGSQEYQNIRSLVEKAISSKSGTIVRDTYSDLKYLLRSPSVDMPVNLRLALSDNQRLERDIASRNTRLTEIGRDLTGFDLNEVRDLQQSREKDMLKIGNLEREIKEIESKIEKSKEESSELKEKIRLAQASEGNVEKYKRYWQLAHDSFLAMEKLYEPFAEEVREKVEAKAQEIFKNLIWKDSHFQNVQLNKKFELQVNDRFGDQAHPGMSAGERQVLSLAFIIAMAKVAAEEMPLGMENESFPIVMDTPFGRLSTKHRENVTETIPTTAKQLILFVTDEELRGKARVNLENVIGAEYKLQFDDETSVTKIENIR